MPRVSAFAFMLFVCACAQATPVEAQAVDLRLASLEDLMRMEVTSASRHEQPAEDVPAAIYVIGREDIRRSGLTSVPELLRLAPGVQVARINSNKWAVSVRGFNGRLYSNKLLVMVDGRSIYNPAFSTVLWDTEDLLIEDIDHIEVIRGPGGAMWGANAVNGVINIITQPADNTRGGMGRVSLGTFDTGSVALRYGGSLGTLNYRLFAQGSAFGDSLSAPNLHANDNWRRITTGFRTDWADANDAVMVQGAATSGQQRPLWFDLAPTPNSHDGVSETTGANVLGRWTRTSPSGASFRAQGYFDDAYRDEAIAIYNRQTWDIDAQYYGTFATRHALVVGGGYRYIAETMQGRGAYTFSQDRLPPSIFNAFAQDTIGLLESRLELTLGAKVESRTWTAPGWQPNARLLWKLGADQRVWAAASRALRVPSLLDRAIRVEFPAALAFSTLPQQAQIAGLRNAPIPVFAGAVGNPDFQSERLLSTEAGYRVGLGARASFDVVGFTGRYEGLQTFEPLPPVVEIVNRQPVMKILSRHENLLDATTRGAEFSGRFQIAEGWQMDSAIATFDLTARPNDSQDPAVVGFRGHAPAYQWRTHVAMPLTSRSLADLHFFQTGPVDRLEVPAVSRLDARLEWSLTAPMSVIASGQNLLDASHLEFNGDKTVLASTLVPRSGTVQLRWRF